MPATLLKGQPLAKESHPLKEALRLEQLRAPGLTFPHFRASSRMAVMCLSGPCTGGSEETWIIGFLGEPLIPEAGVFWAPILMCQRAVGEQWSTAVRLPRECPKGTRKVLKDF